VNQMNQTPDRTELEYQTAQDSAQHHDQLLWTTTGIIWGGSLVLLGLVLASPAEGSTRVIRTVIALFGLVLICVLWRFAFVWRSLRNRKYEVCKAIEEQPGFLHKHHQRESRKYPAGTMTWWYGAVSVGFILVWLFVIVGLWCRIGQQ
jgi:hypothetical protein